ncbi:MULTISPECIES: hypothetical protein [Enterococcus]|uniref:hypothetical protein n=1 Tax=Enterococcus TaxID=1350 RepID=UPI00082F6ADC|nr:MULTISPECIES: hypothetical protein [Enterococcus]
MNRLEQAQSKLNRLRAEKEETQKLIRQQHDLIPFGQPNIIGRPDIYKKVNRYHDKAIQLMKEEEKQEMRIDMLEKVADFKEENELLKDVHVVGKSSYATVGAKTSVNNLDYFRHQLQELEEANILAKQHNKEKKLPRAKTFGTDITKLKRKIAALEEMQEKDQNKVISSHSQALIDSGAVNQWKKKPIYYFVKGLKKVALELDKEGNFTISNRYPAWSEQDKTFIQELLTSTKSDEDIKKETFC